MPLPRPLSAAIPDMDAEKIAGDFQKTISQITTSKIFIAVIVTAASLLVMKLLLRLLDRALGRSKMDAPLQRLIRSLLKGVLWSVTVIVALGCLGIEVTSLVAVLSVVGLAFSLALQNFLSNLAGGMQILASHPFRMGDFVEAGGCSGTVTETGMFYTKLTTPDNKLVQLPNSTIVSANITNFSAQPTRRVELKVTASYDAPTEQVLALLSKMAADHPLILGDPEPAVHVDGYGDSAIGYVMRVWCANPDY